MKKSKALSILLSLSLLASAVIPGTLALPAHAAKEERTNRGMEISKTAVPNEDGTYTITLEAYATGEKIIDTVDKDVPTDIILVLDQSGSMAHDMNKYGFRPYSPRSNREYYDLRHNGARAPNLYHKLEDGSYATVSVEKAQIQSEASYVECPSSWNNASWGDDTDNYWSNRNNLYVKENGEYKKVTLSRERFLGQYTYTYTFPDNSEYAGEGMRSSPGDFGGKGPLYVLNAAQEYRYTYSYTDKDGGYQTIGTSDGNDTQPTELTLYERYFTGSVTRLEALKTAVTGFTNAVAGKAKGEDGILGTQDDIDHRIAVVGFASRSGYGNNTELLSIKGTNSGRVGIRYNSIRQQNYKDVLQSMSTQAGQTMVNNAINALDAEGGTEVNLGMKMANEILKANPVPNGEKRSRIVIVFTDGVPTTESQFDMNVANDAIRGANTARANGATVYSVGIFDGADATSAGSQRGNETQKANWFMQNVSDNKGTPQNPSYYLSASDADSLNSIFQQISANIETGGSSTTLDENAVIRDMISPQFRLPEGVSAQEITLETFRYIGEDQWENNHDAMGAVAMANGDQISVTGFNFKENWCGTETTNGVEAYRGNKLVVSFPVKVKDGFLGGNGVYTNTDAGVYENGDAKAPLFTFERPQVDVKIENIAVTAEDKNVYLTGGLTAEQIKSGATVKVGDVGLDLSKENYGLESWQNEYVDISVTYQNAQGEEIADLNDLRADTTYTVKVTVSPKTAGAAVVRSGNGAGSINVFTPELTYRDSEVYYGDAAPDDFTGNLVSTVWKHGEQTSTDRNVIMLGDAPELTLDYMPEASKISDGKINTKQDISVSVGVKIGQKDVGEYTQVQHQNCPGEVCEVPEDKDFLLHVKTCQLTVIKNGGAAGEPYVFRIMKDGAEYSEVTIVGNGSETVVELPVGSYTIREDEGWSWRYNGTEGAAAVLGKENTSGTLSCTNSKMENHWLNGCSEVVKNIFGVEN